MSEIRNFYEKIENEKNSIHKYKPDILEIPNYILENLKYNFFQWQREAFENFLIYEADHRKKPTHLMFNMATGTGKTLLMAATILYYYKQGYRHFIFFVNQNNIVDKTENNFINSYHTKYLYKEKIIIDDQTISINKVNLFSDNPHGIELKFTTIQKLYDDIHLEKENQTTLEELQKKDIVMLGDEAHHLNSQTKADETAPLFPNDKNTGKKQQFWYTELRTNSSKDEIERKGWEHTVIELLLNKGDKKKANKNILLEFTATIPNNELVAKKYSDKIIYKFGLKKFLAAGYTKQINLIASSLNKKERSLQALIFHWYRHKIALKNGIANFKAVILFRSKTIADSQNDYEEFLTWIKNLNAEDFDFLKNISKQIYQAKEPQLFEMGKSRTEEVLHFIEKEKIYYAEIAKFIQDNFLERNVIITNSKNNKMQKENTSAEQEKLLNSLEDKNNHIRAIFTVQRLTEGWDVLNLFDIVRLYEGQNAGGSTKKIPEATTQEKQLIGRGVRYFPFKYQDKLKNKRKFDNDLKNEMRVLEELFYYTYDEESRYISHLKAELKRDGYISDDKIIKTFDLKEDFKKSNFYQKTKVWYNKREDNPSKKENAQIKLKEQIPSIDYKIRGFEISEQEVDFEKTDEEKLRIQEKRLNTISMSFSDIETHIFRKAINIKAKQGRDFFQFAELNKILGIQSIDDLQNDSFLGKHEIHIKSKYKDYEDIPNKDKLNMTLYWLKKISTVFKNNDYSKIGSEFIAGSFEKIKSKTKSIKVNTNSVEIARKLNNEEWYILDSFEGTSEEQELIKFIEGNIGNLEEKYDEFYLLRNEEVYTIYDFEQGRGFQPDFLLFLKNKDNPQVQYQVFIEAKGDLFYNSDTESWKEEFLKEISRKYSNGEFLTAENKNYRLIGMPFFNSTTPAPFKNEFDLKILDRKNLNVI